MYVNPWIKTSKNDAALIDSASEFKSFEQLSYSTSRYNLPLLTPMGSRSFWPT